MTVTSRHAPLLRTRGHQDAASADPGASAGKALSDAELAAMLLAADVALAGLARTSLMLQYAVGVASWWLLSLLAVTSVLVALRALQVAKAAEPTLRRGPSIVHREALHAERLAVTVLGGWCLFLPHCRLNQPVRRPSAAGHRQLGSRWWVRIQGGLPPARGQHHAPGPWLWPRGRGTRPPIRAAATSSPSSTCSTATTSSTACKARRASPPTG